VAVGVGKGGDGWGVAIGADEGGVTVGVGEEGGGWGVAVGAGVSILGGSGVKVGLDVPVSARSAGWVGGAAPGETQAANKMANETITTYREFMAYSYGLPCAAGWEASIKRSGLLSGLKPYCA
jgi:hypothetical protein